MANMAAIRILTAVIGYGERVCLTLRYTLVHSTPTSLWILVPSFLSFVAGLGLGSVSDRLRNWLRPQRDAANN